MGIVQSQERIVPGTLFLRCAAGSHRESWNFPEEGLKHLIDALESGQKLCHYFRTEILASYSYTIPFF